MHAVRRSTFCGHAARRLGFRDCLAFAVPPSVGMQRVGLPVILVRRSTLGGYAALSLHHMLDVFDPVDTGGIPIKFDGGIHRGCPVSTSFWLATDGAGQPEGDLCEAFAFGLLPHARSHTLDSLSVASWCGHL